MAERIVVIDGYTLNPGDIGWVPLERLGPLTVYDRTPADQVVARAAEASYLLTNKVPFDARTLEQLPKLRYIGVTATGYNIIDVPAAIRRGITVTNVPTYGTDSVAQHAAAMMLDLARRITQHDRAVHEGQWSRSPEWCFTVAPIIELTGRTLGIVGLGRIGLALARIAAAMGMRLIAFDTRPLSSEQLGGLQVQYLDMDEVFRQADVVSLHCPLSEQTKGLVNLSRLVTMKKTAFLINTSRGPLVDNQALADALSAGTIAGAALDVLDVEPPPADNPLLSAPNCLITPHIAWYAREARMRLMTIAADNLKAFLLGKPVNVVH